MRRPTLLSIVFLTTLFLGRGVAAENGFKVIRVDDLAALMAKPDEKLAIYDADPPSVRENEGVIPGAKLLPSSNRYDVAKELPADKDTKLVFYCHNTR
ncbi:MAG: rhodanese-like domain-containing protein [Candidatus Binatia bacterium]